MTLAAAQQGQEVPKTTAKPAASAGTGAASSWVKVCTKDEKTGNKQVCLVRYEGLEPKTGAILIAAAVRTIEGEDKQHLLVNVSTAYSLAMSPGVQIKIDEGKPAQLQYAVCFSTSCQVQMDLSKEFVDEMRKGKQPGRACQGGGRGADKAAGRRPAAGPRQRGAARCHDCTGTSISKGRKKIRTAPAEADPIRNLWPQPEPTPPTPPLPLPPPPFETVSVSAKRRRRRVLSCWLPPTRP